MSPTPIHPSRMGPDDVRRLARVESSSIWVSLFSPTHRAPPERSQDQVRLRNLLAQAESLLRATTRSDSLADTVLGALRQTIESSASWGPRGDGLALFATADDVRIHELPTGVLEQVVVQPRPYLRPLLPLLSGNGTFHVLPLSLGGARLIESDRFEARPVAVAGMPAGIDDALSDRDDTEQSLQFHTGAPSSGAGKRPALYHGQGGGADERNERIAAYCRQVDNAVRAALTDPTAPIVVAAVDYVASIFQSVTRLPEVIEAVVHGNPDCSTAEELRDRAWPLVASRFRHRELRAAERIGGGLARGQASVELATIARAAFEGRVEVLFVPAGPQRWGRLDQTGRVVQAGPRADEPGQEDILDWIAAQTLRHGGEAYPSWPQGLRPQGAAAALLRY